MARVITQETFDSVVQENVDDFDMNDEEAVEDAVKQFEAQGVDLSSIVMEKLSDNQQRPVILILDKLGNLLKSKTDDTKELTVELINLRVECDKGLAQKVLAGKRGAYNMLIDAIEMHSDDKCVAMPALLALTSLMTGNPDLLDVRGIGQIMYYLDHQTDKDVLVQVLKWIRQCCIKHEKNRQAIFDSDILSRLKTMLHHEDSSASMIRSICGVFRALVLDDDIRVEFGRAHEHARQIALEVLCGITDLLMKHKTDADTVGELMQTLASLVVKDLLCEKVEAAGGLTFILDVMKEFPQNEKLMKQSLKLLKALCGDDSVKAKIMDVGCGPFIISTIDHFQGSVEVAAAGCACIAALTLRSPASSKAFYEAGAPDVIVQAMKIHKDNADVQKQGSWAVRNIVSRDRTLCARFLELGVEEVLQAALKKHKTKCDYDVKAALRDLGCEVELKERWTGKGGKLNH